MHPHAHPERAVKNSTPQFTLARHKKAHAEETKSLPRTSSGKKAFLTQLHREAETRPHGLYDGKAPATRSKCFRAVNLK